MSEYWMQRLDAHMERGNAAIERANELAERTERAFDRFVEADDRNTAAYERNTAAYERNTAAYARNTAAFERWESQQDEMHEFMREITLRVERAGREHSWEIRRMGDEIVSELRAGRGALLAILDRLEPGDSGSAA